MEILTGPKKRMTHVGVALLLAGFLTSCSSKGATCESPRASSEFFLGDSNATDDQATWQNGIALHVEPLEEVKGVVVGYRGRNGSWHDSLPVDPSRAGTIALRVGQDAVSFSVYVIATKDSAVCASEPKAVFSGPQPIRPLIDADATLPEWK